MKRTLYILMVAAFLLSCAKRERADFSGHWVLDKSRTENLPRSFQQVDTMSMNVQQRGDSIYIATDMVGAGQHVSFPPTLYTSNGIEQFREDTLRGGKRWSTGTWSPDGRTFTVVSRVEQNSSGPGMKYTQTDIWEMPGQEELRIAMKVETSDSLLSPIQQRIYARVK